MIFAQKHIIVVGCARRLGLVLTGELLKLGCRVSGLYKTPSPELNQLKSDFADRLNTYDFDLQKPEKIPELVNRLAEDQGPHFAQIHVSSRFYRTPLGEVKNESWDELFDTNVKGHFFLMQALVPYLERPSHIINLVDIYAIKPLQNYLAYTAAKGALLTLTRNLANELAPHTCVNAISPGPVLLPEDFSEEDKLGHASRTLLGRIGTPEDVWNAVRFFLESRYLTGVNLCVDGGSSLI